MSDLTDFAQAGFDIAAGIIGQETMTIDSGPEVSGVQNEDRRTRDWESGGWDQEASLKLVFNLVAWTAAGYSSDVATYQGKPATVGERSMRIIDTSIGKGFVEIDLGDAEEAK